MRLKSVKLSHFRGYRATTAIPIDAAMTGIVGRIGYGKSTIFEALAIFIETEGAKAGKSDINCFSLAEGFERFEIARQPARSACADRGFLSASGGWPIAA